jgi:vancomycin permeability regulator SanA
MLEDRPLEAIKLYESGAAPKIIMSGDHSRDNYDEVNVMKAFAIERGVPSEDIFMDHAGFSTYESVYRAKEIFGAKKIIMLINGKNKKEAFEKLLNDKITTDCPATILKLHPNVTVFCVSEAYGG